MEPEKKKHGGLRQGAGRPKSKAPTRTLRGFMLTDDEWELIKENSARKGMSTRKYVSWLVSKDKPDP